MFVDREDLMPRAVASKRRRMSPAAYRRASPAPRPGVRSRTAPLALATYRRRRRLVGLSLAVVVAVLSLGAHAGLAAVVLTAVFSPAILVPLSVTCLVGLLKPGSGGRRPASPAPAAGAVVIDLPVSRAA
jgi:hypothetical protein